MVKYNGLFSKIYQFLLRSIRIQLFLTLCSLPIFIYWGLPVSIISIIGNIIFTPFLMAFLTLSSIIYLTELCCIPNAYLIYILDIITNIWVSITSIIGDACLIVFAKTNIIFIILIPILALLILHNKKLQKPIKNISALFCLSLLIIVYNRLVISKPDLINIGKNAAIFNIKAIKCLIIKSYNSDNNSSHKYNIKKFDSINGNNKNKDNNLSNKEIIDTIISNGIRDLDLVIIDQVNSSNLSLLMALIRALDIKKIYIPNWKHKLNTYSWSLWINLLETCSNKRIIIQKVSEKEVLNYENDNKEKIITIVLEPKLLKKNSFINILGICNGKIF